MKYVVASGDDLTITEKCSENCQMPIIRILEWICKANSFVFPLSFCNCICQNSNKQSVFHLYADLSDGNAITPTRPRHCNYSNNGDGNGTYCINHFGLIDYNDEDKKLIHPSCTFCCLKCDPAYKKIETNSRKSIHEFHL